MTATLPTWVPTVDQVLALHADALEHFGGAMGVREESCPERSIETAYTNALYAVVDDDGEPDQLLVATHLACLLARNHCFVDGNKRVAWYALVYTLRKAGVSVASSQADAAEIMRAVAEGKVRTEGLHSWLVERVVYDDVPMA